MALPDTLEQVGIVVGSAFLLSLPGSALSILLFGVRGSPSLVLYLSFVPGLLVGLLVAAGKLPITYHHIWRFSIASYLLALSSGLFFEPGTLQNNGWLSVGWWLASVAVGLTIARYRLPQMLSKVGE